MKDFELTINQIKPLQIDDVIKYEGGVLISTTAIGSVAVLAVTSIIGMIWYGNAPLEDHPKPPKKEYPPKNVLDFGPWSGR